MKVRITLAEFQEFCRLQAKRRWDWPATFSTNSRGDIWPYVRNGYTPPAERENVRECSRLLDRIADLYKGQREEGGRFFINEVGVFWKDEARQPVQFVEWNSGGERLLSPAQAKVEEQSKLSDLERYQEMMKQINVNRKLKS